LFYITPAACLQRYAAVNLPPPVRAESALSLPCVPCRAGVFTAIWWVTKSFLFENFSVPAYDHPLMTLIRCIWFSGFLSFRLGVTE